MVVKVLYQTLFLKKGITKRERVCERSRLRRRAEKGWETEEASLLHDGETKAMLYALTSTPIGS
jgi:hypothetical protein